MSVKINYHTEVASATPGPRSVFTLPATLAVAIAERIRERHLLNQLLSMSEYQLKDIGVSRHELVRQSMLPIWRIGG